MQLDLFPLDTVLFPGATMPLRIFEPRYRDMIQRCVADDLPIGIVLLRKGRAEGPGEVEIHEIGTISEIISVEPADDETLNILVAGRRRFHVQRLIQLRPRLIADIVEPPCTEPLDYAPPAPFAQLRDRFADYHRLLLAATGQWTRHLTLPADPEALTELVGAALQIDNRERQILLEQSSPARLARLELTIIRRELPALRRARADREERRSN